MGRPLGSRSSGVAGAMGLSACGGRVGSSCILMGWTVAACDMVPLARRAGDGEWREDERRN